MKYVSYVYRGDAACGVLDDAVIRRLGVAGGLVDVLPDIARGRHPEPGVFEEIALADVALLPPVPAPGKILCVATNFREDGQTKPVPSYPLMFTRFAESVTGHDAPILKPAVSEKLDFEGEMAAIIGVPGHKIAQEDAFAHIAGFACFNDGSVRDWQKHSTQFTPGKNFYRTAGFGPWMLSRDAMPAMAEMRLETRINGAVKQEIGMDRMIFDPAWLVAYISTFTPLAAGDVVVTGTPSGFGSTRTPPEFLAVGDVVEVEVTGLGVLRNHVVQDDDPRGVAFS